MTGSEASPSAAREAQAGLKTVDKALSLLGHFGREAPEWALSDLARAAGTDKVTTLRALTSLARHGFVEQAGARGRWRLGPAVLRLARLREALHPLAATLQPLAERLARETGETAHACTFDGAAMTTVAIAEPDRATRVSVLPAQPIPVYASASGLAFLARSAAPLREEVLARVRIERHARNSPADLDEVRALVETAARIGHAVAAQTFEDDVTGVAAPILDWQGRVCATIAAACVASRTDAAALARVAAAVRRAAAEATAAMGGEPGGPAPGA